MSGFDVDAQQFLKSIILPLIIVLALLFFFVKNFKKLSHWFFAWLYLQWSAKYGDILVSHKEKLFAPLSNFKSLDWDLRNRGLIRILEIGVGPGSNFNFYPKNARLIAVDPNPYFKKHFEKNKAKFPGIKLEKLILGEGEDLREVASGSVDVVVTTSVLCSVRDIRSVLSEIHRVLAPGGKYFFLEHVTWPNSADSHLKRFAQKLANPIWPLIFDGCKLNSDIEKAVEAVGFENTEFTRFIVTKLPKLFKLLVGPHIYGTAQKTKKV